MLIKPTESRRILLLPGDGIGPEVVNQARHVVDAAVQAADLSVIWEEALIGGCAVDALGSSLPPATLNMARQCHGILLGAVGGPQYDALPSAQRPEAGLLSIRQQLGLFANLRPVKVYPALAHTAPLKPERLKGVDIVIVRELTGGAYFGQPRELSDEQARDSIVYSVPEIERIAHAAFQLATQRQSRVCSVDKANVLATSQLWRRVVTEVARQHYPNVQLSHLYVDNAAMQLILKPAQFDVILTENMFGDILSDEASVLSASLGLLPSASLGATQHALGQLGLYEPCHGSAPDIVGQDKANPIGAILSAAMLCRYSLGWPHVADAITDAVESVLADGLRTADIGLPISSTAAMGQAIAKHVNDSLVKASDHSPLPLV